MIAVKKLNSSIPGVKDKQFENEAYHLMRLKHPNVVLLVGWCSQTEDIYVEYNGKYICAEKSERLLCLEYMPKGSLRGYLSGITIQYSRVLFVLSFFLLFETVVYVVRMLSYKCR
jgi:serine/threonine protein kinase